MIDYCIKKLRKKHKTFAYIRKKLYFCGRLRKLPLLYLSIKSAICNRLVVGGRAWKQLSNPTFNCIEFDAIKV